MLKTMSTYRCDPDPRIDRESERAVGLEESTQAEWLHEVFRDLVKEVYRKVRRERCAETGDGSECCDSVWHGHEQTLKQMVRAYGPSRRHEADNGLRPIYRGRGIRRGDRESTTVREQWLGQIPERTTRGLAVSVGCRFGRLRKQDGMLEESRRFPNVRCLRLWPRPIPVPNQAAVLEQRPGGRSSAEYEFQAGRVVRRSKSHTEPENRRRNRFSHGR